MKKGLLSIWWWEMLPCGKNKIAYLPITTYEMDSNWIKTMKGKTIKLIEKKKQTGEYLCNLGGGNYFLSTPHPNRKS